MEQKIELNDLFVRLSHSKFRNSFHLKKADVLYIDKKGLDVIEKHARDFVTNRLSPANPTNDGKQTPYKGHPVFVAQHATATCCRGCLEKWHKIKQHQVLDETQIDYIVAVIMAYIKKEYKAN